MNRIDARFEQLRAAKQAAFIAYITAGDPTLEVTADLVPALERAGADIIELGVPFSDPLADGVVNQEAAQRALAHGATLARILDTVRGIREHTQVPLVLFTYFNPVFAYGLERFAEDCAACGVDGVLCVDLPPEESGDYKRLLDAHDIATVYLLAPTSSPDRIALVSNACTGFVYYVSRTGVTGVRAQLEESVNDMVGRIRAHTSKPVAVGFGISTPEQAAEVAGFADGVIVGSAIVRMVGELGAAPGAVEKVAGFVKSLADAVKQRPKGT